MRDTGLMAYLMGQPWALQQSVLRAAESVLMRRLEGERIGEDELSAIVRDRDARQSRRRAEWSLTGGDTTADQERGYFYEGNVAVVPVQGVLCKYADMINGLSQPAGMTSAQVSDAIRRAGADRRATAGVMLDIDSPGGTVAGVSDMAKAVEDVRTGANGNEPRPVVAFAHDLAASAAYWLASAADEIFMPPTAEVGSIGVYAVAEDNSAYYENKGIKRTLIASGQHKGGGAEGTKLTADHIASMGENVMALAAAFKSHVADRRKMGAEQVDAVSTGRVFVGTEAVANGLADGVASYGEVIAAMNNRKKGKP